MSVTLGIEKLEIVQITKSEHQYKILIFSCSRDDGKILHMVDELQYLLKFLWKSRKCHSVRIAFKKEIWAAWCGAVGSGRISKKLGAVR